MTFKHLSSDQQRHNDVFVGWRLSTATEFVYHYPQHGSTLEGVGGAGTVLLSRATMFNVTSVLIITVEVCD